MNEPFMGQLDRYYAEVIAAIRQADDIPIFDPGAAKGEIRWQLDHAGLGENIVALESSDKMTGCQVAGPVREYFHI